MLSRINTLGSFISFALGVGCTVLLPSVNSSALAQRFNPNSAAIIPLNYGKALNYDRSSGQCIVTGSSGQVVQTSNCRKTWTQIVYTADKLVFYDRTARQLEVYVVNSNGIGNPLQKYGPESKLRGTWAQITSPSDGVIRFEDENRKEENYRIDSQGRLKRI